MNGGIMNEDEARRLLGPLAGDPPGPSRVDIPRAMAEGRRRRRTRFWATGTAIAALTTTSLAGGTMAVGALNSPGPVPVPDVSFSARPVPIPRMSLTAPPSAKPSVPPVAGLAGCTVTRLPTDGVDKAIVSGGDPSGRWLVGRLYPRDFDYPQVIWKDGRIATRFKMSGADGILRDVNRSGQAVGSDFSGDDQRAWIHTDGKLRRLKGGAGHAEAISDAGVIVGGLGEGIRSAAARWDSPTTSPVRLKVPAGTTDSTAFDIDDDGTILGEVTSSAIRTKGDQTGYLWLPDGTARPMPLPDVDGVRADLFWPESIRNGWVAGRSVIDSPDGSRRFAWFRYRVATGTYERLPDEAGMPDRVAANGWVLGTASEPRIYADGGVTKLPRYKKGTEYQMASYSDDGLTAAGHMTGVGDIENQPLVWRCRARR
jgi:hypothetical protein